MKIDPFKHRKRLNEISYNEISHNYWILYY